MAKIGRTFPISYKKAATANRFACATYEQRKGAVFTNPLKKTQVEHYETGFCAWIACLDRSALSSSPLRERYARQIPEAQLVASI